MTRRTAWKQAYAVVRIDEGCGSGREDEETSGPGIEARSYSVTVKEVVTSADEAKREVSRLNDLNADKGCRYCWQGTRYFQDGGSFGSISSRQDRAHTYHDAIRQVLMAEWDPIGVHGVPEAQDEYDSYVGPIHTRLIRHEQRSELFAYLWELETCHMGLSGNRQKTEHVADLLIDLRDKLERTV